MKNIVERAKEKRASMDELVATLEKIKDKLPKEAKDALDKHKKKKAKK